MERFTDPVPAENAGPGELDALLAAIAKAIEALVAWNLPAFQSAVEGQRAICEQLARRAEWRRCPKAATAARKVQELNRVYERLLCHSLHWTHTLQSILEAGGDSLPRCASVHFRG